MARSNLSNRWLAASCAAALTLSPLSGLAQDIPRLPQVAEPGVTILSPLTAVGLAPIPDVGQGASWFTPENIEIVVHQARNDHIDAKAAARQCHTSGVPQTEAAGDFGFEALYDTESKAQASLQHAGEAAAEATRRALDARVAIARGEGTQNDLINAELGRQAAVRAFQAAQWQVLEAQRRIADLQDLLESDDGMIAELKAQVEAHSIERANNIGTGNLYVPATFRDLRLTDVVVRQTEEGGIKAMRVSGKIVNPRRGPLIAPPLWVAAQDRYGTSLKEEMMEADPAPRIAGRDSLAFTFALTPIPDEAEQATVTFAPFHHEPRYKPVSAFCEL